MSTPKLRLPVLEPDASTPDASTPADEAEARAEHGRRTFLQARGATAALTAAGCSEGAAASMERFFQAHYHELSEDDKRELIGRLEAEALAQSGVRVNISDPPPIPGVQFAYALNVTACTGCRQCVYACAAENNLSRDPQMHYIRVVEFDFGSFDLVDADHFYDGEVPHRGKLYMPISCHQCTNPPCVAACPVKATWREDDGIVVIDYDWCIGCRYCQAACPYGARRFNFAEPAIRPSEINTDQGLLSNRARPRGVMEKCHFCLHRTRRGELPACQEACPVGARKFGDLADPHSDVRQVLATKRVYVLKEELGTHPRFFYFFT